MRTSGGHGADGWMIGNFERPNPEVIVDALRQRAMVAAPRELSSTRRIDAAPALE